MSRMRRWGAVLWLALSGCGGESGAGAPATGSRTLTAVCADLCSMRDGCGRSSATCRSDCELETPDTCAAKLDAAIACSRGLPQAEQCSEASFTTCGEALAAVADCVAGGDGTPTPTDPTLGTSCDADADCGGLECPLPTGGGEPRVCSRYCDVDSECPGNGLCLLFDGTEGHVCVRRCEVDADCAGTPTPSCITGGEQIYARKICAAR